MGEYANRQGARPHDFTIAPLASRSGHRVVNRRTFVSGSLLALAAPLAAEAQQPGKVYRIGAFGLNLSPELMRVLLQTPEGSAFLQALNERGWVEGQNFGFEIASAEGKYE